MREFAHQTMRYGWWAQAYVRGKLRCHVRKHHSSQSSSVNIGSATVYKATVWWQSWVQHLAMVSEGSSRRDRQSDERRREQQHPVRDGLQGSAGVAPADSEHESLRRTFVESFMRRSVSRSKRMIRG